MSYDVSLRLGPQEPCPTCGHSAMSSGKEVFTINHTSNTSRMWKYAGCDLRAFHGKTAAELAPSLVLAIAIIKNDLEGYREYEPENKWGTVESTLGFLKHILVACVQHPNAVVVVGH